MSGMHARLVDIPQLAAAAKALGRRLVDVRVPPENIPIATGKKRSGKRLLTVGTDCALGKKYTALVGRPRPCRRAGLDVDFRATGQTGIMIAGAGIPDRCGRVRFHRRRGGDADAGRRPTSPRCHRGPGIVCSIPPMRRCRSDCCTAASPTCSSSAMSRARTHVLGYPDFRLALDRRNDSQTIALGSLTNPAIRCVGVSLNTSSSDDGEADRLIAAESRPAWASGRRSHPWRPRVRPAARPLPGLTNGRFAAKRSRPDSNASCCRASRSRRW